MNIMQIARLLQSAPQAAQLVMVVRRAAAGDQAAIDYIRAQGWHEILDLAVPGAGQMAQTTLEGAQSALLTFLTGGVIEGEYHEIASRPPYAHFVNWLSHLRSGTVVFIGPKGEGKTAGLQRVAEIWHAETGYPVYQVNLDPHDQRRLPWAHNITMVRFIQEMKDLSAAWAASSDDDESTSERARAKMHTFRRRIYLIDEAALAMSPTGPAAGKTAARTAMGLSRHIPFLCGYVGQWARNMPADMFGSDAIFVRHPRGKEPDLDRNDAVTRDLWRSAIAAFEHIYSYEWFAESPVVRSWSYVDAPGVYTGLVPNRMPGSSSDSNFDGEIDGE